MDGYKTSINFNDFSITFFYLINWTIRELKNFIYEYYTLYHTMHVQ